jgi:hypothetical protein
VRFATRQELLKAFNTGEALRPIVDLIVGGIWANPLITESVVLSGNMAEFCAVSARYGNGQVAKSQKMPVCSDAGRIPLQTNLRQQVHRRL